MFIKLSPMFLFVLSIGLQFGCASSNSSNTYHSKEGSSSETRPLVDDKYRLKADREKFDEIRAQVPSEKKTENDEVAFIMQLMNDPSKTPSNIREKFDSTLGKKRERFSKDIQKEREDFTKKERKDREVFLKQMEDHRKDFLRSKHTKEERDDFFNHQEELRKEYFENQRERRNDFEADVLERRKDFEDYARSKSSEFQQEYRAFQRRHEDYEKEKEKQKKIAAEASKSPSIAPAGQLKADPQTTPEVKSFLQEFMEIPAVPGTQLESGD